ncbi:sugar ABC transporter substrate-binding protein [Cellulomonas cellasea]|uniref:sugar ABC transporter substrate-binding protein n=1 Tax=Cellulomonas cellasea TaxID=43670 RepID=UPI0025A394D7|nr:sugar ABC transporter substrate-binding protein [Cellulomonas cellasea]MDM8086446.1 sugar ABC transporter substrate-binding protein [Cellulomonas cellasea]
MNRSRMISLGATAGLAALALTACAGGGSSSDGGAIALTLTDTMSENSAPIYDEIYQACAAEIGVTVTSNHVAGSGLIATVLQQASSKTLPDVLMLDNPDVQQIAASGALSPLADHGITGAGFPEGVLSAGTYEGDLYGIAPIVNSLGLFYNADMLAEAGIEPPTTWDELSAAAAALTADGRYGIAFSAANSFEGTWQFLPFLWSNGADEDDLTSDEAAGALAFVDSLVADGSASASVVGWSPNDVNDQFIAGKAAMMINGPWNMPSLTAAEGLNFDSVPIPVPNAGDDVVAPLGGETFTIPQTGDKDRMAAAGKLVACVVKGENQLTMATRRGAVPSDSAMAEQAATENPLVAAFAETVQTARSRTALLGEDWPAAATQIYTAVQLALTDKSTPEEAWAQAAG